MDVFEFPAGDRRPCVWVERSASTKIRSAQGTESAAGWVMVFLLPGDLEYACVAAVPGARGSARGVIEVPDAARGLDLVWRPK